MRAAYKHEIENILLRLLFFFHNTKPIIVNNNNNNATAHEDVKIISKFPNCKLLLFFFAFFVITEL